VVDAYSSALFLLWWYVPGCILAYFHLGDRFQIFKTSITHAVFEDVGVSHIDERERAIYSPDITLNERKASPNSTTLEHLNLSDCTLGPDMVCTLLIDFEPNVREISRS
jgi:hypothetical protein